MKTLRSAIPLALFNDVLKELEQRNMTNIENKGPGGFASNHEIYGVLAEEMDEYLKCIHQKAPTEDKIDELYDIAVAAIFGIASIKNNNTNW